MLLASSPGLPLGPLPKTKVSYHVSSQETRLKLIERGHTLATPPPANHLEAGWKQGLIDPPSGRGHATPHMPVERAKCWWLLKIEPSLCPNALKNGPKPLAKLYNSPRELLQLADCTAAFATCPSVFPDPGSAISPAPGKNVLEMTSFPLNRDQLHCLMIGCHTFLHLMDQI